MKTENTAQQNDPLGTFSAWVIAPIAAGFALLAVGVSLWRNAESIASVAAAGVSVALILAASAALVWGALPRRAPFRRHMLVAVVAFAVAAAICFTAATWGLNRMIQDDWGSLAVAVLLAAMAQLRPPRELAIAGGIAAAMLAGAAAAEAAFSTVELTPGMNAIIAATPPVLVALGAAAFGNNMLVATARWRARAREGMARLEPELREGVLRRAQQAYVTQLNQSATPLFERVLAQGEVTAETAQEASAIAAVLRESALDALRHSWLDSAATGVEQEHAVAVDVSVDDSVDAGSAASLVDGMGRALIDAVTIDQRVVTVAAMADALRAPGCDILGVTVALRTAGFRSGWLRRSVRTVGRLAITFDVGGSGSSRVLRAILMPYLSVLRVTSLDAAIDVECDSVTIAFSFDATGRSSDTVSDGERTDR